MSGPSARSRNAPLFVERHAYRRRRLMDSLRAMPVLGLFLWSVPLLWRSAEGQISASGALLYVFGVWLLLILLAAALAVRLARGGESEDRGAKGAEDPQ